MPAKIVLKVVPNESTAANLMLSGQLNATEIVGTDRQRLAAKKLTELDFLAPLPVSRIHGVGKVMDGKLAALGIRTVGELRAFEAHELEARFGRYGRRLSELAHGIDRGEVKPDRPTQSISSEDTFASDVPLEATEATIRDLAAKTWAASRRTSRIARTVVLKLKTREFRILTRSRTPEHPPRDAAELTRVALELCRQVDLPENTRYRLVGVGLGNFREADAAPQPELFD